MGVMIKIKPVIIAAFFFALLFMALSSLLPSKTMVVHSVLINAPIDSVKKNVTETRCWPFWNLFILSGTVPYITEQADSIIWMYKDKRNIIHVTHRSDSTIRFLMHRDGELPVINDLLIHSFEGRNDFEVEWRSVYQFKWYPWEKFSGIFVDKATAASYDSTLATLKKISESGR